MKRKRGAKLGGMRGMKARQLGRESRTDGAAQVPSESGGMPEPEDEPEEILEQGMLVDQGDGTRVLRRGARRSLEDAESHECPDEPPKGWGDG